MVTSVTVSLSLLITERRLISLIHKPVIGHIYRLVYTKIAKKRAHMILRYPSLIEIETCNACNLRCKMCPAIIGKYGRKLRRSNTMSMHLFKKIVDEAKLLGFTHLNLNFYNEPLLDQLIFDRIAYAKSKGFTVSMFTNGTLLTEDKAERLTSSDIDLVAISIDGATKKTYEKIRVSGHFHEVIRNVFNLIKARKQARRQKPSIRVVMTITSDNIHEVRPFHDFWKSYVNECDACPDKTMVLLPEVLKVKGKFAFPCRHLWNGVIVTSDGRVPLCCMDYNCSIMLGDLSDSSLREILASKTLRRIRELHMNGRGHEIQICRYCDSLYVSSAIRWIKR